MRKKLHVRYSSARQQDISQGTQETKSFILLTFVVAEHYG